MRKYEIQLPLNYRDGKPIEREKIRRVHEELLATLGSFTLPDRTTWKYDGVEYVEIVQIEIVTTNDKVPKKLLSEFKERVKESFRQTDILITTHLVQTA